MGSPENLQFDEPSEPLPEEFLTINWPPVGDWELSGELTYASVNLGTVEVELLHDEELMDAAFEFNIEYLNSVWPATTFRYYIESYSELFPKLKAIRFSTTQSLAAISFIKAAVPEGWQRRMALYDLKDELNPGLLLACDVTDPEVIDSCVILDAVASAIVSRDNQ